ncbi:hypothetical protein V7x_03090 [Crateriforma conspicua]|uniref:Uncharacterized protein n=1 Tax=Crateriforma conspicua TaxID=2527996 RepID=A0A5C6FT78_9PLAN|nr:hypothetical protein V7x_03090 [Crateriforma conspicua]
MTDRSAKRTSGRAFHRHPVRGGPNRPATITQRPRAMFNAVTEFPVLPRETAAVFPPRIGLSRSAKRPYNPQNFTSPKTNVQTTDALEDRFR